MAHSSGNWLMADSQAIHGLSAGATVSAQGEALPRHLPSVCYAGSTSILYQILEAGHMLTKAAAFLI